MAENPLITTEYVKCLFQKAIHEIETCKSVTDKEIIRKKYLGRRGLINQIISQLKFLTIENREKVGELTHRKKIMLEQMLDNLTFENPIEDEEYSAVDITLPGRRKRTGILHIIEQTKRRAINIFNEMGFSVVEGPIVETVEYNFDRLNFPQNHPARDQFDTIWVNLPDTNLKSDSEKNMLLRTHTSNMQIRVLENSEPPVKIISPGTCFRFEATDSTHEWQFHQIEGISIDKSTTFANLKYTLYEFAKKMFSPEVKIRFRCDYFPFVEPGVDMSINCFKCSGNGCVTCGGAGWIEILGAGMVHPNVLRDSGIDPNDYQGFAFGMGLERITMLKYEIKEIRNFFQNDLDFLWQFRTK